MLHIMQIMCFKCGFEFEELLSMPNENKGTSKVNTKTENGE